MPFPILHSFAGYAAYKASKSEPERTQWYFAILAMVTANLPDFDFLPGVLLHEPMRFHRQFSHSFAAAFLCGFLFAILTSLIRKRDFWKTFVLCTIAYLSHIFMDMTCGALPVLWPLSDVQFGSYVTSPAEEFRIAQVGLGGFVTTLLSPGFLFRMLREAAMVLAILMGFYFINNFRNQMPLQTGLVRSTALVGSFVILVVLLWGML